MNAPRSRRVAAVLMASCLLAVAACSWSPGTPGAFAMTAPSERAVPYGSAAAEVLDLYRPVARPTRGTLVYVHGGSFTGGWRTQLAVATPEVLGVLAMGWAVVSIDYRLLPSAGGIAAQVADVRAAVAWLRAAGSHHGLDARRVVVVGHSAGGTLAERSAVGPAGPGRPDAWMAISGVADIGGWATANGVTLPTRERLADLSPLTAPGVPEVPGRVVHSREDPFVPIGSARALVARLRWSGASVDWDEVRSTPRCHPHSATCGMDGAAFARWLAALSR